MKKKWISVGTAIGLLVGTAIIAYAVTNLFLAKTESSDLNKKTIFQFDLFTGLQAAEVGPGDSVTLCPTIYNDATENMYVFIVVDQPICNDQSLYTYTISDCWKNISNTPERQVYAYAGEEMTVLLPGETTEPLTDQITMISISNAEYALIDDINVSVTAYATGTEDVSGNPTEAWEICKYLGNIE